MSEKRYTSEVCRVISLLEGTDCIGYFPHRREDSGSVSRMFNSLPKGRNSFSVFDVDIGFDIDLMLSNDVNVLSNFTLVSFPSTVLIMLSDAGFLDKVTRVVLIDSSAYISQDEKSRQLRILNKCKFTMESNNVRFSIH